MFVGHDGVALRDFDRKDIRGRPTGYRTVSIRHEDGRCRNRYVHELVLLAFVGPRPSDEYEVLHGNGERSDNRLDNLRWGTVLENAADRDRHGRVYRGADHWRAKRAAAARERAASVLDETESLISESRDRGCFDDLLDEAGGAAAW